MELQNIFDRMKSGLGDSELDDIIQNVELDGQKTTSQPSIRVPMAKRITGTAQSAVSPSKTKLVSGGMKDTKLLLEEVKKARLLLCISDMGNVSK